VSAFSGGMGRRGRPLRLRRSRLSPASAVPARPPAHARRLTRELPQQEHVRPVALGARQLCEQDARAATLREHELARPARHKVELAPRRAQRRGRRGGATARVQLEPRERRRGTRLGVKVDVVQHAAVVGVGRVAGAAGVKPAAGGACTGGVCVCGRFCCCCCRRGSKNRASSLPRSARRARAASRRTAGRRPPPGAPRPAPAAPRPPRAARAAAGPCWRMRLPRGIDGCCPDQRRISPARLGFGGLQRLLVRSGVVRGQPAPPDERATLPCPRGRAARRRQVPPLHAAGGALRAPSPPLAH
jgi:hypothetical protein